VGSSSFTKWTDVQKYFPEFKIINRGFGGSTLNDLIFYAPQVIYPYKPKQVVIYCGDNDLAAGGIVYAASVSNRFRDLFRLIRKHLPDANITFISIKPSPSNLKLMSKADSANRAIKLFISSERNAAFVDVYHAMLGGNGRPLPSIFLSDSLHMNEKGYAIWKKEIEPYLEK
jgi:lysophospholipase L1-like esterase